MRDIALNLCLLWTHFFFIHYLPLLLSSYAITDSPSEVDSETPHQGEKDDRSIVTKSRSRKKKEKTEGATSKHGTIGCIYYGAVKNATGEDWDEVFPISFLSFLLCECV